MKKFLYRIWSGFLTWFGDIKIFRFPMWIVYDPDFFKVDGKHIIDIMKIIQPGDVILRGYDSYLDSRFIDGDYSHAGIYVGNDIVVHAISPNVDYINIIDFAECDRIAIYRPLENSKLGIQRANDFVSKKIPYDFGFNSKDVNALYCFELAAQCYKEFNLKTFTVCKFLGLVKKNVYLAKSFAESEKFKIIFEYNPKKKKTVI